MLCLWKFKNLRLLSLIGVNKQWKYGNTIQEYLKFILVKSDHQVV